jgi:lipopolysaccharide transport system ATP-binding protein
MTRPIIEVEKVSKSYRLGQFNARTLHEEAERWLWRRRNGRAKDESEFWALKDISFTVEPGEVLGIIGRNGAGKSTLLKILSRITEPTSGEIRIRGRVASLLEVGTGFHPELTGRENIYLNGAILGMSRAEIKVKFDEIVAFAEVERFLETPVKRYSSGMYVRLAFAVAAHLEPEILIVDEVLAVGDAEFQRRCLGKMQEVSAREGRTVVFVSHNMVTIQSLCSRTMLVSGGTKAYDGDTQTAIETYLSTNSALCSTSEAPLEPKRQGLSSTKGIFAAIELLNNSSCEVSNARMGQGLLVRVTLSRGKKLKNVSFGVTISDTMGTRLFSVTTLMLSGKLLDIDTDISPVVQFNLDALPLLPGRYFISLALVKNRAEWLDAADPALWFEVFPDDVYKSGIIPAEGQGLIYVRAQTEFPLV